MKKKEGMKKLSFEEEIGLNKIYLNSKVYSIFSPTLLFTIVLLSFASQSISFSQVTLNGFGRYLEIANTKSISNLFTYDLNKDGFVDIAGLDSSQKFLIVHFGKGVNQFESPIKFKIRSKADRIHAKDIFSNMITNIVIPNKLSGNIQIYEFRKRSLKFLKEIYVGKYPDDILIDELDNHFPREIIFYGKNLIGLGIVNLSAKISQIEFIDTVSSFQSVNVFY
ncbi:MAG: hypothetical protein N3A61_06660, partial [Ignavibacteria bacterium]|nr:hypothetical protein [Ignavibacteria bacterium]